MSRIKLLLTNFLVYGFGGIISNLIPLIMVPIITRLMPNSFYYGLSDLSTTIVSLFSALAVMGMYDAMFRMFFEKKDEDYKKDICSSAFAFTMITSVFVALVMILLQQPISRLFYSDPKYGNLVMLCAASVLIGATNSIIAAPTRMQNKKTVFLLANTIFPILSYAIAIPLILNGYYLIALPLATVISGASKELTFAIINQKWFRLRRVNWKYIGSMLKIALPLLPNFIIYWIFNSSDRVMISNILNPDQEGIYAVSSKIGHISQLIYTAFAGGWQFFAFSIMRDKDNKEFISKVFNIMMAISLGTTLLGTSICKFGVEILFEEEYWSCYICIPYLYLAPLLLMLFQIATNQFLVIKKTWPNVIILSLGAIVNIILNLVLIPIIGIEGASLATFIGYFISIILCLIVLKHYNLIVIDFLQTILPAVVFVILFGVMRFNLFTKYWLNIPLAFIYILILILIYMKDIKIGLNKIKNKSNDNKIKTAKETFSNSENDELLKENSENEDITVNNSVKLE